MRENVTLIPARRRAGNRIAIAEERPKLRVAAYCRVSTDSDEQTGSYEVQVQHYTDYIKRNREWELAGIYTDDGISGTNTKKREGFMEMIDDCMVGKIDMVLTKSISRFARNTIDCLKYVRMLKEKNIAIIFEKENINTLEASGELLLTIMASLAQQESQSLSQNVKLGLQFRYQNGQVQVNHNHFFGYTKDEDGNLIVDEDEAVIVKRIFREYLEGASFRDIANGLERDRIQTGGKKYKWHLSTVQGILQNEKYMGDALLQKTITTDFIEKTRIKNDGSAPQYYVKDSQEAIIPRDVFTQVQEEMVRRANMVSGIEGKKKRVYSSKYALSSICICPKCGDIYRRIAWNNRGKRSNVWRCCTRVENGPEACNAPTVQETELQEATVKAINLLMRCSSSMKEILAENISTALADDNSGELEEINKTLKAKQKELVKLAHANKDYSALADEIDRIRDFKQQLLVEKAQTEGFKSRIAELQEFLDAADKELTEYDETMVRKYINQIMIYDDKFTVEFKAGVKLDIVR
ncbi:MAG: recombinase family protein [Prevotella sp.]|nr:recombinase family protein [Prevotella sp.]